MELRCSSCLVSLTIIPLATTYKQCGHKLCHRCYLNYNQSRVCVMCIYSEAKSKRSIPETHTGTPQPRPPLHTPPPPSASTLPTPDFPASSPNITHTTTTTTAHTGASQNHALEAGSRSSPHKEDSSQSSPRQTGDNWRPNDSEQWEWGVDMGQPGMVQQLTEKFDSGITAPQEGAAGQKSPMLEDPRAGQGSIRRKDSHNLDSVTGVHSSVQLSKGPKTPHIWKGIHRSPGPYPLKSQEDDCRDSTTSDHRETLPPFPRHRNASLPRSSTSDRSRISASSSQQPAHRSRSSSRTREAKHPSPSPTSPTVSSPSTTRPGDPSPGSARPREPSTFNIAGKVVKCPGKVVREGWADSAVPPSHTSPQQPQIKQALFPVNPRDLTTTSTTTTTMTWEGAGMGVVVNGGDDLAQHYQATGGALGGGLSHRTQAMEVGRGAEEEHLRQQILAKDERLEDLERLYQEEIIKVKAQENMISMLMKKDLQHEEELSALRPKKEEVRSLIGERNRCQEEINELKREATARKEKMARLRGERDDYRMRFQELENSVTPLANKLDEKVRAFQGEINELKSKEATLQEEVMRLRRERDQCREEAKEREVAYALQVIELKRSENQITELLRERDGLRGEVNHLIQTTTTETRERGSYREEVDTLKGKTGALEYELAEARRERDGYKEALDSLKEEVAALENEVTDVKGERDSYKHTLDTLEEKIDTLDYEVTGVRRERDNYKEAQGKLKEKIGALENEVTGVRRERDSYTEAQGRLQEKIDGLENEVADVRRERDSYKEEADRLKAREEELNQMAERDTNRRDDSKVAQMELEIRNCRTKIAEHEGNENALRRRMEQMERERDSHEQETATEVSRLRKESEEAGGHRRRAETLEKQLEEVKAAREDLKQDLLHERDEVERLERQNNAREKELRETETDRDNYRAERDKHKQTADELTRRNSVLESHNTQITLQKDHYLKQRNQYMTEIKKEREKQKQEVERLKKSFEVYMRGMREEKDQLHNEVLNLRKRLEGAGQEMKGLGHEEELSGIPPPPSPPTPASSQPSEAIETVSVGLGGKEEEEEVEVATLRLPNLGNSCYINAVVQCLYHLPPLRTALAQYTEQQFRGTHQHDQDKTGVAQALAQLFGDTQDEGLTRLFTRDLKQVLGRHDEAFMGKQQQEAHDLFSAIVTWLHSDLKQHDALDYSCGSSLFKGQLETRMVCPKLGKTLTHADEAYTSISLPVVGTNRWSLKDLLDKHFRVQTLEWDCDECYYSHQCDHVTHVLTCPPVLVIHFSRVANFKSRRKTKVDFPVSEFSLQDYMVSESSRSPTYKLVGVVCHQGTMVGGHYTAYCRYGKERRGNKWRFCSDTEVWRVDERDVLSDDSAHMLFYIRE